ncbi:hypothetical protein [Microbulbifer thermotolerans]|uniref:hypothetical protein n=1 Tax=Microbulbifer thermotolerans TaxID=252514 RepID=UPI002248C62E|nr:hypothetical protein [Microbulbifer thermotolerans]MCX2832332.1 hypothetical protein [Microbulbifer thermotolerans]
MTLPPRIKQVFIIFIVTYCALSNNAMSEENPCKRDKCFVSIISLIANGSSYHGKKIIIQGVFYSEDKDAAIYFDKGSMDFSIDQNGIYIYLEENKDMSFLNGKYVIAEGVFNAKERGASGSFSGGLESVIRLHP